MCSILIPNFSDDVRRKLVFIIDLLPPMGNVNEAQWTSEWLTSSGLDVETQIFKGIDDCWPTESELTKCMGVVMTGSTCSCVNNYPHTEPLFAFFKTLIYLEIPLLTICYSAQMLVRWLAGKENVIHLPEPHVGFIRIQVIDRRFSLLNGEIDRSFVFSSAQSDGFILPDEHMEFSIQVGTVSQKTRFIHGASAAEWKYQAFQLSNLPVWGIQFHPNWPADGAENIFRIIQSGNSNTVVKREGIIDAEVQHHIVR